MNNRLYMVLVLYLLCQFYGAVAVRTATGTKGYTYIIRLKFTKNSQSLIYVT